MQVMNGCSLSRYPVPSPFQTRSSHACDCSCVLNRPVFVLCGVETARRRLYPQYPPFSQRAVQFAPSGFHRGRHHTTGVQRHASTRVCALGLEVLLYVQHRATGSVEALPRLRQLRRAL